MDGLARDDTEVIDNALSKIKKRFPPENIPENDKDVLENAAEKLKHLRDNGMT